MNNKIKVMITIIGAINVIFNLFIPLALSLMLIKIYNIQGLNYFILLIVGFLSSLYRAIDIADIETFEYIYNKVINKSNGRKSRK